MLKRISTYVVMVPFHILVFPVMLIVIAFQFIGMFVANAEEWLHDTGWLDEDDMIAIAEKVSFVYSCFGIEDF